ncbi:MAG: hypothetical protein JSR37_07745 [Verrucomicrobia bacterium]|nr:hypothetical protein [Verrucomicrobiota bacterium]
MTAHSNTAIIEAIETLTSIADLEIEGPIAIAEHHELQFQEVPIIYRTVHWLHRKNAEKVMVVVRDTFRTILHYLKQFYRAEYGKLAQHESVEGIKTIMVLVGEAAKKVDKYTRVFIGANVGSIKESKEFKDLWGFYERKIAPIAVQESLTKWMREIPVGLMEQSVKPKEIKSDHLFIDLDTVKKDSEYELFFIRKENGTRFFSPRLLRNIKLVCNFEEYFKEGAKVDSLNELKLFKDIIACQIARNIVRQNWQLIDGFFKVAKKSYNDELVSLAYKAIVAIMLAANQTTSIKELAKSSSAYLVDFQRFLREFLSTQDFQRIITYPPKNEASIQFKLVELVQHITKQLYSGFHLTPDSSSLINELILKGKEAQGAHIELQEGTLSNKMALDYDALLHSMDHLSNLPILQIIDALQDYGVVGYDPLLLQNMPTCIFDLFEKGKRIAVLRVPSPTSQEFIHKAQVNEEFKSYVRSITDELLVFNLQDRTNLREHARSVAIEELQKKDEFAKSLVVVSMTKDSDFYHQIGPYEELNHAELFIEQLLEHVASENSGYYYPAKVAKVLFSGFTKQLAEAIHKVFFANKNVLSRNNRLDFIELFYTFIQLKVIETVQPGTIAYSCKDAIDIAMPATAELFLLLKLINLRPLSASEEDYLKVILYGPSISYRGRLLFPDRFSRLSSMTKRIEGSIDEVGGHEFHKLVAHEIAPLFDKDIFNAVIAIPQQML